MKRRKRNTWHFDKLLIIHMMLLFFLSPSFAQKRTISSKKPQMRGVYKKKSRTKVTQDINYVIFLKNDSLQQEGQENSIVKVFNKFSQRQQKEILAFMVKATTDSLNADLKEPAMTIIDNYRMLASPDDEYLGSLVITQGKYYYDKMDAAKLSELQNYLNDITARTKLDYSSEIEEIDNLYDGVLHGGDNMLGYWVADICDKEKADPFYMHIYRDSINEYHVDVEYSNNVTSYYVDLERYCNSDTKDRGEFCFSEKQQSLECARTAPKTFAYCWASEKLNVGKEGLATALRMGVRGVSNSLIGELARSSKYSIGTSMLGSVGSIFGEVFLNSLIDGIAKSRKKIEIISGNLQSIDRNSVTATIVVDIYKLQSDNDSITHKCCEICVNMVRVPWEDESVKEKIAFVDGVCYLRQERELTKLDRKRFYKSNPQAKKIVKRISTWPYSMIKNPHLRDFNKKMIIQIKEYNRTH